MVAHRWCVIVPVFFEPLLPRGAGRKGQKRLLYLQQPEAADFHFFILPCWYCLLLLLFKHGHNIIDAASHCVAILLFAAVHAGWMQGFAYYAAITDRLCQLALYSIASADLEHLPNLDENNVNCRRCCWSGLPSAECTPGPEVVHGHCWLLVHYRRCHQLCSSRSGHVVPWTYSPWIWSRIRQPVGKHLPAINYISNQSLDCFCLPSDQCPGISDADSVLCVCLLSFLHCALQAVLTLNTQHSILGAVMQIIKQGIVCSAS